jgi:hypothetical protein
MKTRLTQLEAAGERPVVASEQLKTVHHVRIYERAVQATVARLRIEHKTCVTTPLSSLRPLPETEIERHKEGGKGGIRIQKGLPIKGLIWFRERAEIRDETPI